MIGHSDGGIDTEGDGKVFKRTDEWDGRCRGEIIVEKDRGLAWQEREIGRIYHLSLAKQSGGNVSLNSTNDNSQTFMKTFAFS
jgi:hypothetical protein